MKSISQKNGLLSFSKPLVYLVMFLLSMFVFTSCEEDTPEEVNEDELITTVTITLTNGNQVITLKYKDLDGDGPNKPSTRVSEPLIANTVYSGTVSFLNETATTVEDITEEILAEAEEHQVFYQAPAAFGTFTYDDEDANGKPLGLGFTLTTGASATTSNLTITLRHEPNKSASGVSDGNISNAGGATDVEVVFPIQILSDVLALK